jgi:N-acetylmuramoyl-L-alanine amidase
VPGQVFKDQGENEENPIDLIVIDPGHGGEDTGAKGPGGVLEKEVTLQIAKKVAEALRDKGFQVVLTRDEDVFIPLGERTALANRKGADLFISIHANAAKRKQASGSETYFLSRAKNDEARAVATLENASLRFEKPDFDTEGGEDLDFILLDMVQNEYLKESQDLAALIQDNLEKHLPIPNRGVDQAGFYVLNKAYMPAVLVETAFISNANEAKLLKKDSFQDKIAQAITQAVGKFKDKYEKINRAESR